MPVWQGQEVVQDDNMDKFGYVLGYVFIITKGMMVKKVLEDFDGVQVVRQFMDMQKPDLTTVLF